MTPERIAEIEADITSGAGPCWPIETNEEAAELCRLARLGLRVESAPTTKYVLRGEVPMFESPNDYRAMTTKRVSLVVLEDSK